MQVFHLGYRCRCTVYVQVLHLTDSLLNVEDHKGGGDKAESEDDTDGVGEADANLAAEEGGSVVVLTRLHLHQLLV